MKQVKRGAILPKIATTLGGVFLGSLLTSSVVFAGFAPKIMEVQPTPADNPTQLIVYGQYFGLVSDGGVMDPDFTFGTGAIGAYNGYLPFAADQSACPGTVPPLDTSIPGYSCVVLDIPGAFQDLTPGDYLLEIWSTSINLGCVAKPSYITF